MKLLVLALFILLCGAADVAAQTQKTSKRPAVVIDNMDFDGGTVIVRFEPAAVSKRVAAGQPQPVCAVGTGKPELDKIVVEAARRYRLDPNLLISVMHHESGFNERAVSNKGAMGLMQLVPATARRFGVKNIFDPKENIHAGAQYLRFLMDLFGGDVKLALAGYNAGEGAVIRHGYRLPPYQETRSYVGSILSRYRPAVLSDSQPEPIRPPHGNGEVSVVPKAAVFLTSNGRLVFSNNY